MNSTWRDTLTLGIGGMAVKKMLNGLGSNDPGTPEGYMSPKKMAKQQMRFNENMMNLNLRYLPQYGEAERGLTEAQRSADSAYLAQRGQGIADTLGEVSPAYRYLGQQSELANQTDPLLTQLRAQAAQELDYNRSLSPEQEREATQQVRAGMAARGLATGPSGIFEEALNRDRYATQRANERRAFAGQVYGLGQQDDQNRRGFLLSAANAQLSPVLSSIYGNRSGVSLNAPSATASQAPQLSQMTGMWDTVTNANYARQISDANNRAAMIGSLINAGTRMATAGA